MFRSATFKLTIWYLAIAMFISVLFSFVLYNVTTHELDRGMRRESMRIMDQYPRFSDDPRFMEPRRNDYDESVHQILLRLVALNICVLFVAGASSYLLARHTLEPIEAAHEQQKRFTADVSHELRTPLTALRMESEVALLQKKPSVHELKDALQSNIEEVSKLEALINNLLRLAQLEVNDLQQTFTTVSVDQLIDKAHEHVFASAKQKQITIDVTERAPLTVYGDGDSLKQALVILLDNAVKYSPAKSSVSIVARKSGNNVAISISDQGSGIPPESMKHIFDRFYRADQARTKDGQDGFGLGLSIARMISDLHKGTLKLESVPDTGTTATIELPLAKKSA